MTSQEPISWDSLEGRRTVLGPWGGPEGGHLVETAGFTQPFIVRDIAAEREIDERRLASSQRMAAKAAADEQPVAPDTLAPFLATLTPRGAARARATLQILVRYRGLVITREAMIRQAFSDGARVQIVRRERRLMDPNTTTFLDERTTTKTGMDFALHLTAEAAALTADD